MKRNELVTFIVRYITDIYLRDFRKKVISLHVPFVLLTHR